jgi:hypothetical protein
MPTAADAIRASLTAVLPLVPGAVRVTVTRTDPDTGATVAEAGDVWAKRTKTTRSPAGVGDGEVGQEVTRWRVEGSTPEFVVRVNDRITDPDGVTWVVLPDVETACLGRRFVCSCVKER